ncbi:hypothetical protein B0H10DRAFT_1938234 [Mycena sp. CBHHK59/15]|nr:hypothetical protein B0H10DRAFT_1938234 [Mycena sp. CBHHK59/15]
MYPSTHVTRKMHVVIQPMCIMWALAMFHVCITVNIIFHPIVFLCDFNHWHYRLHDISAIKAACFWVLFNNFDTIGLHGNAMPIVDQRPYSSAPFGLWPMPTRLCFKRWLEIMFNPDPVGNCMAIFQLVEPTYASQS